MASFSFGNAAPAQGGGGGNFSFNAPAQQQASPSPEHAVQTVLATVDAWCNQAHDQQAAAIAETENAAAAVSSALTDLAAAAAALVTGSESSTQLGAAPGGTAARIAGEGVLEAACVRLNQAAAAERETLVASIDPASFPSKDVGQCLKSRWITLLFIQYP